MIKWIKDLFSKNANEILKERINELEENPLKAIKKELLSTINHLDKIARNVNIIRTGESYYEYCKAKSKTKSLIDNIFDSVELKKEDKE